MRSGIKLLSEVLGLGSKLQRRHFYKIRLRMWLNRGESVHWREPWGLIDHASVEDGGTTLITAVRMDRVSLIPGLFYGMEGMRVGGIRELKISPHMAYRDEGVEGTIPPNAVLRAEVAVLCEIDTAAQPGE